MIVEDNPDIRDLIGFILTEDAYQLKMCPTAISFQDEIAKKLPDVIVMDIMLPDGDGTDLCRVVKNNPATQHIPVLLMSAHKSELKTETGANSFIPKPFNIIDFKQIVESYL